MNEPVPKGPVQSADQATTDLHEGVSGQLNQIGHPNTPRSINPEPELPQILDDVGRVIGGMTEEGVTGVNTMTHTGTVPSKVSSAIIKLREFKRAIFNKEKKAA